MVGFEIDGNYFLIEGTDACSYSATFQSVVGTGTLSLLETPEEKVHGLNTIMKQTTSNDDFQYDDKMVEMVAIFALKVKMLSCKRKG